MNPNNFYSFMMYLFILMGIKTVLFGQYWPWQYRNGKCPHCKK